MLFFIPLISFCQRRQIDSLTKLLPSLSDSSRIDCLNKLSVEYYINILAETYINVQTDTANLFASQAYREAKLLHYDKGIAEGLQNLGEIARDRGDLVTAENYFRRSIPLFEKTHDLEKYSWANITLGWVTYLQCRFEEAKLAFERARPFYFSVDNKGKQAMYFRMISYTYTARGYNEVAFENMIEALRITAKSSDVRSVVSTPQNMAALYKAAGENETALAYYLIAATNAKAVNQPVRYFHLMGDMSVVLKKYDSAIYYYQQSHNVVNAMTRDTAIRKRDLYIRSMFIGEVYLKENKWDMAIDRFKDPLQFFETGNDRNSVMWALHDLGQCYLAKQNAATSFVFAQRLLRMAQASGARPYTRDAFELYWKIYDKQGKVDSAYKYNLKFTAIKDSIMKDEYVRNIALSEIKSQDEQQKIKIDLLQKDQQINRQKLSLQQETLKGESQTRKILLGSLGFVIMISTIIFRLIILKRRNEKQRLEHVMALQQLENEKAKIEFQKQASDLEMQALRAQMNPHFIFNCLSSINRYILINRSEEASDYLTKFSRLIRMALHNSEKAFITLENELEALRLYLDLERLRFRNAFNFQITCINSLDESSIFIPPMLIQPFAENAIWHGLMHKEGIGSLDIVLSAKGKTLTCSVTDDGIGRDKAAAIKSKSAEKNKSMGVKVTSKRLELLSRNESEQAIFTTKDLVDGEGNPAGTKVILQIRYRCLEDF